LFITGSLTVLAVKKTLQFVCISRGREEFPDFIGLINACSDRKTDEIMRGECRSFARQVDEDALHS
jgi:hypothetical protein